ncbi:hypothetical protein [Pelagicoccus mobilis]|uniref:Uncharacterized protein n=1 Tax=Pelagicoccus mobilis TaxID=415221 RepID=A0A934RW46_9BACT|nr:hypothetical protein [Pelagicoccus mobilis]MBK1875502.1 hypothetical protein [Pelagicoccus mobilis]
MSISYFRDSRELHPTLFMATLAKLHIFAVSLSTFLFGLSSALASQLTATGSGPEITIQPHLIGYNNQTAFSWNPWNNADNRDSLALARPSHLRYPGGTVSTYWDFRSGKLFKGADQVDATSGNVLQKSAAISWVQSALTTPAPNPLADLHKAYQHNSEHSDLGAFAPVFCLNLATPGSDFYADAWERSVNSTPESVDWWDMLDDRYDRCLGALETAETIHDWPIHYIELGNEYHFGGGEPYVQGLPLVGVKGTFPGENPTSYASAANDWAAKLKTRFPDAKICAIGGEAHSPDQNARRRNWNLNIPPLLNRDHVDALAIHVYIPQPENLDISQGESALVSWLEHWTDEWEHTKQLSNWDAIDDWKLWFTEWDSAGPANQTWGHALQCTHTIHSWLAEGQAELISYHIFWNSIRNGREIYPQGRTIGLFAMASHGTTSARQLTFDSSPKLLNSDIPSLITWQFDGPATNRRFLLINLSGTEHTCDLSTLSSGQIHKRQTAYPNLASKLDPGEVIGLVPSNDINLPAFSITVLSEVQPTFPDWQSETFTQSQLADAVTSSQTSDPDKDGIPNLLEFLLGSSPFKPNSITHLLPASPETLHLELPILPQTSGHQIELQYSSDLMNWSRYLHQASSTEQDPTEIESSELPIYFRFVVP